MPRKTRGPRTPNERAHDAARSAATLFEKLPASGLADDVLKPVASFLRFYLRSPSSEVTLREMRLLEKVEREFIDFMGGAGRSIEYLPVDEGLAVERMVQRVQCTLRDAKTQLATQLAKEADDA